MWFEIYTFIDYFRKENVCMLDKIYEINDIINGLVWGPYMVALLVGVGIYLSIRLGFLQVFRF